MRLLVAFFLMVGAAGCQCSPTTPTAITRRLKNGSGSPIFVDDTNHKLGLTVQRNVGGMLYGFEDTIACSCSSCDQICNSTCSCDAGEGPFVRRALAGDQFERSWS